MATLLRTTSLLVLLVALAACGATGGSPRSPEASGASTSPSDSPAATPDFGAIDHPTGPTDVVLRFEEGGGFVMAGFLAKQAPHFTLYGDGTVVVRNPMLDQPLPVGSVTPFNPFETGKLTEAQMQELLTFALGESGLGAARPEYPNDQVADAPTAVFTVNAGGLRKTVSVYALGLEVEGAADAPARRAFRVLADRLLMIGQSGWFEPTQYVPAAYRGVLMDGQPGAPDARAWPWPEIAPSDFVNSNPDPNAFQLATRVMTPEEIEVLGIEPFVGGFQGLTLTGPDDVKAYAFALRPLLPDEAK